MFSLSVKKKKKFVATSFALQDTVSLYTGNNRHASQVGDDAVEITDMSNTRGEQSKRVQRAVSPIRLDKKTPQ